MSGRSPLLRLWSNPGLLCLTCVCNVKHMKLDTQHGQRTLFPREMRVPGTFVSCEIGQQTVSLHLGPLVVHRDPEYRYHPAGHRLVSCEDIPHIHQGTGTCGGISRVITLVLRSKCRLRCANLQRASEQNLWRIGHMRACHGTCDKYSGCILFPASSLAMLAFSSRGYTSQLVVNASADLLAWPAYHTSTAAI